MVHLWLANMRQGNNIFHCSSEENKKWEKGNGGERQKKTSFGTQIANTNTCEHF